MVPEVWCLGLADDAEDEVVELGRGLEQQPALQGAGGDFDEGVLGDEAERSWHTELSARDGKKLPRFGLQDSGTPALGTPALGLPWDRRLTA